MKRSLAILMAVMLMLSSVSVMKVSAAPAGQEAFEAYQAARAESDLRLWYTTPTTVSGPGEGGHGDDWQKRSLPIGNGKMGAMFAGQVHKEKIQFNEESLWTGGPSTSRPNYNGGNKTGKAAALDEIQALLLAGNATLAASKSRSELVGISDGYGSYQNFGWLDITHTYDGLPFDTSNVGSYVRDLDLETATTSTSFTYKDVGYIRESFMSYPSNVMVMKHSSTVDGSLNLEIGGTSPRADALISASGDTLTMKGSISDNQMRYEAQVKISHIGGTMTTNASSITISDASEVTFIFSAATDYKNTYPTYRSGSDPNIEVSATIAAAVQKGYDGLYSEHLEDYVELFSRVDIQLGGPSSNKPTNLLLQDYKNSTMTRNLEILLFQYGRYMSIASSREGTLPSNLQGVWNKDLNPSWSSDYHMNVNLQMNYWPAYVTNLAETALPLVDYIDSLREPGRVTAKEYMGIESTPENPENGFSAHTQNTIFGWTCPGWSFDWGWSPAAVPWILQNVWEHYEFTGDTAYLESDIYPIMREQSIFWQQALMLDPADGKYYSAPAYSPEHGPITKGNVYEHVLIKQLLDDTITASEALGVDTDLRGEWQNLSDNIRVEEIGDSGQLKEWFEETTLGSMPSYEAGHRHMSHLLGLYPGDSVSIETPELLAGAVISLNTRTDSTTGWGIGQRINAWARVQDGEHAYSLVTHMFKNVIHENLFNIYPPFQIDGNFGYTSGFAEMLLQSNLGFIQPIPAIPMAWSSGSVKGLVARGNFEIGMEWSAKLLDEMTVLSNKGDECIIRYPNIAASSEITLGGTNIDVTVVDENTISFPTTAGEKYTITITDKPAYAADVEVKSVTGAVVVGAPNASIQMQAVITPEKAADNEVAWTVTDASGAATDLATISATGLLTASDKSGTVRVTAKVLDPVGASGYVDVAISLGNEILENIVDNKNLPSSAYSGGWSEYADGKHHGGSIHYVENGVGASITYSFTGTGIEVYTPLNATFGSFEIYVDDVLKDTVPLYQDGMPTNGFVQHKIFTSDTLTEGIHTIKLVVIARDHLTITRKKAEFDFFKVLNETLVVSKVSLQSELDRAQDILLDKSTSYTPESYANFQTVMGLAVTVMNDPRPTEAGVLGVVDQLTAALDALVEAIVDKAALGAVLAEADGKIALTYTPASWAPFIVARASAREVYNSQTKTQLEINSAAQALTTAMNALVLVAGTTVDKVALESLLTLADGKQQSLYTPESWTPFEVERTSARAVYNNSTATQLEVDSAVTTLTASMGTLEFVAGTTVDKAALGTVLAQADGKQEATYTPESWAPFAVERTSARAVYDNSTATQLEVDSAVTTLTASMGALEFVAGTTVDKAALGTILAQADGKQEATYTPESWAPFAVERTSARAVYDNSTATQLEVDSAVTTLTASMGALEFVAGTTVDKAALGTILAQADGKQEATYTPESWAPFAVERTSARAVYDNSTATQLEVDSAVGTLTTQIQALVEKVDPPVVDPPVVDPPVVDPPVTPPLTVVEPSGRRSSGSSSGTSTPDRSSNLPQNKAVEKSLSSADAKAAFDKVVTDLPKDATKVVVKFSGKATITGEVISQLQKQAQEKGLPLQIVLDTIENGKVVTRLTVSSPLTKSEIATTIALVSAKNDKDKSIAEKFGNSAVVADFAQPTDFGGIVKIYIKLPAELIGKPLEFHRYNPTTKLYALEEIAYKVDANGYVSFETNSAENLVISAKQI